MASDIGPDEKSLAERFPSNSKKLKRLNTEGPTDEPKVKKIVKHRVIKKPKGFLDNLSEAFFGSDANSVMGYVLQDVLVPAAKNTLSEMVSTGIEMLLFGEAHSSNKRDKNRSYVSYGGFFKDHDRQRGSNLNSGLRNRARHKFDDLALGSRMEAQDVVDALVDLIENYEVATVADFYDLVGMESVFSDQKYGWNNLSRVDIRRTREGYVILLPKPIVLD